MGEHFRSRGVVLHHGDCVEVMRTIPDASVHAVVTDPPYGLDFMGKGWDNAGKLAASMLGQISDGARTSGPLPSGPGTHSRGYADHDGLAFELWCTAWAAECIRILKPGGHLVAFGGSRTWHRLAAGIEDAGFEIRDSIAWLYGSGFPKSLNVSKAIDKTLGATGTYGAPKSAAHADMLAKGVARRGEKHPGWDRPWMDDPEAVANAQRKYEGGSGEAREWQGWGTALKPAFEPIVVARKPLAGTVATNVLAHGAGALNIDATRIEASGRPHIVKTGRRMPGSNIDSAESRAEGTTDQGRWPANVVLDESQAAALDVQSGLSTSPPVGSVSRTKPRKSSSMAGGFSHDPEGMSNGFGDQGGASRFFPTFRYEAKAPTSERPRDGEVAHPTVKPLDLMRWLCRLVTPPGGTILEPFAGSGTTLEAAVLEGFEVIGIEQEADYLPLIVGRLSKPLQPAMFGGEW